MFNNQGKPLELIRKKYFSNRKILCTGNPDNPYTIAYGIKKLYPDATFIHKSNGWDLTDIDDRLIQEFKKHNTFINASYIAPGIQSKLLTLCNESSKFYDVINIGSTHEYDGLGTEEYQTSKFDLRTLSLALNTFRFRTCHLILGLIKTNEDTPGEPLTVDQIAEMIKWILEQDNYHLTLMSMDNKKEPW